MPLPLWHQNDFITYQIFLNMKTQFIILLFSVLTLNVFATGVPSIAFANNKAIIIKSNDWKSKTVDVEIKEATGTVILSETLNIRKSDRKYNLKNLPDGQYTIEIADDLKILKQQFFINKSEVVMSEEVETTYKPFIIHNGNNLDVNLMTLGNPAFINIIDNNNNIVYADKQDTSAVHKRYDISSLTEGTYTITVGVKGKSFSKDFTK
jgi:hypothetical protein